MRSHDHMYNTEFDLGAAEDLIYLSEEIADDHKRAMVDLMFRMRKLVA